jgi:iron(III) transport system substrate-binding protein
MPVSLPRRTAVASALVIPTALGLLTLAGCSSSSGGSGAGSTTITLYSGQHEQTTDKLVEAFTAATGIKVNVRNDDEDALDNQLQTEGSHSPADVFFTENTMPLQDLAGHNLLAPISQSTLAKTAGKYDSPSGDWVGVSARVSVIVYNPSKIAASALPKTVLQVADPQYKGKVAIAPGESDFQPIVTSVEHTYGTTRALQWLDGIKSNAGDSHTYPDNETIVNDVNKGQVAFGIVNQYYWWRLRAEIGAASTHSKIAYFTAQDPGYVINVSGAGVLAASGDKPAAQKFVAFLVSKAGQEIVAHSDSFEYPLTSGVKTAAPETPFAQLQPDPISLVQLGNGHEAIDLMHEAQLL